jgi:hypothetical protein
MDEERIGRCLLMRCEVDKSRLGACWRGDQGMKRDLVVILIVNRLQTSR